MIGLYQSPRITKRQTACLSCPELRVPFTPDPGQRFQIIWKDVRPESAHEDALADGAIRFNRLERAFFSGGAFCFGDTAGDERRLGQIFHHIAATNPLELFYEGTGGLAEAARK